MASQRDETQEKSKGKNNQMLKSLAVTLLILALGVSLLFPGEPQRLLASLTDKGTKSLTLPSVTVNLEDSGYIKTTITLEYMADKQLDEELEQKSYKVKDCIITVLRNTSVISLQDPKKTDELKNRLLAEINNTLDCGKISGLYFEEFIVQ
ncbi:MAG TPA: flagellar basal body-associated FliL family protein [Syntrophomonas sp.]|nr:flagellar basal body-associated FliL family protein [Syntrophomonas sp.]